MNASQIEDWGNTLLSSSYSCAFISWQYNERHLGRADVRAAMAKLSDKAASRASRKCSRGQSEPPPPPPPPPTLPGGSGIVLQTARKVTSGVDDIALTWSGAAGSQVDLYRNGRFLRTTVNDGRGLSTPRKPGTYTYKVCEAGKTRCSNTSSQTVN